MDDGEGGVVIEDTFAAGDPTVSGSEYTVKIKPGLKWSDGEAITSGDFVFAVQRVCDPATAAEYSYILGEGYLDIEGCSDLLANEDPAQTEALKAALGVAAPDETTVVYTLTRPNERFKTLMSLWVLFPAPKHVIDEFGDQWTSPDNIVTSGPFMVDEIVPRDHVTLVPNPNWTAGQQPALQELTIRFIDDLSTSFRNYTTDELDMARIQPTDIQTAEDQGLGDEVVISPTARITTVEMQMEDPVLSKFEVRLALSRAIDREALNETVYDGVQTPAFYWVVKGLTGHQGNEPFEDIIGYNPDAAKQALADAGYPDGEGFPQLTITYRESPDNRNEADFLIAAWNDILGITVVPEFVDGQTRSAIFNEERFQLFQGGWQLDYPDIENPLLGLFDTDGGNNHYNCSMPEIDAKFQEAINAADDEARIAAYQEVETLIIENLCGTAPMYQNSLPFLVKPNVGGVVPNGTIDAGMPGNYCAECWYIKAEA
jgi:oligopeptide transport system substrate-binding protein